MFKKYLIVSLVLMSATSLCLAAETKTCAVGGVDVQFTKLTEGKTRLNVGIAYGTWEVGKINLEWDGSSEVGLSGKACEITPITIDDKLIINNTTNSKDKSFLEGSEDSLLIGGLNSILSPGQNTLGFKMQDIGDNHVGISEAWVFNKPSACIKGGESIAVVPGSQNLSCCSGLKLCPPAPGVVGIRGTCRKECTGYGFVYPLGKEEYCIGDQIDIKINIEIGGEYSMDLEKERGATHPISTHTLRPGLNVIPWKVGDVRSKIFLEGYGKLLVRDGRNISYETDYFRIKDCKNGVESGLCGPANGQKLSSRPTTGLCKLGTPGDIRDPNANNPDWMWPCKGINGGTTVYCRADKIENPVNACGSAAETSTHIIPSQKLCSDGSSPKVYSGGVEGPKWPSGIISGDWYWWCGNTMCHASDPYKDYKGPFASTMMESYTGDPTMPDTASVWLQYFCSWGMPSKDQKIYENYDLVSCKQSGVGTYGGCDWCVMSRFDIRLKPSNEKVIACNSKIADSSYKKSISQKGDVLPLTEAVFTWDGKTEVSLTGNETGTADFDVDDYILVKNKTNGKTIKLGPNSQFGTWTGKGRIDSILVSGKNKLEMQAVDYWDYNVGINTDLYLSCNISEGPRCGSANGKEYSSAPKDGLCEEGNATQVKQDGNYWVWSCRAVNNQSEFGCKAKKVDTVAKCGSSNRGSFPSAPTTGLCSSGTASVMYGTGPWIWLCQGTGTKDIDVCFAFKDTKQDGVCGSSHENAFYTKPIT